MLAYRLAAGCSEKDYDEWLYKIHYPDLLENPKLKRITLHSVSPEKAKLSSGKEVQNDPATAFWRLAELHFDSVEDYRSYVEWFPGL